MMIDDFIFGECIGKGSFGEVYYSYKKGNKKRYAIKKYDKNKIDKTDSMKYLTNEVILLQILNHPNIIKYEGVKKSKNHYYIITEYCNGGELAKSLEEYINQYGHSFTEEIVQHFMRQIIDAFKYMHERKIIHRDIKLENILLHYDNEIDKKNFDLMKAKIKIIDFGFSCKISKSGLQYTALGNYMNMDPLIIKKAYSSDKETKRLGYNEKADIWSLGTICYEMIIGRPIFDFEDMEDLIIKVEEGNYSIPTNLSFEIVSFINGMLQYESKNRLSAEQLSRHAFLTKDVKEFRKINLKSVEKKIKDDNLNINFKKNKTIWSIFNEESEEKLISIESNDLIKPINDKEKKEFDSKKKNTIYSLQLPANGIPDNPTEQKIGNMTKEELEKFRNESQTVKNEETNYIFSSGIYNY